jgi:hypothetical protein
LLSCSAGNKGKQENQVTVGQKEIIDSTTLVEDKEVLIDIDSLLIDKDITWFTCVVKGINNMKGFMIFSPRSIKMADTIGVFHCLTQQLLPKIENKDTIYSGTWPTLDRFYFIGLRKSNDQIVLIGEIENDSYCLWNPCAYQGISIFKTTHLDNMIEDRFYYKKDKDFSYFKDRIAIKKSVF